jgi:predicted  nucleic acid-binding Zn-ribbon protein
MSPIAKIFTVLNLVLAALFLGWAANAVSAGTDFKKRYEDEASAHKATQAALGTEKSTLVAKAQELENARNRLMAERDEANANLTRLREDLTKQESRNGELGASITQIQTTLEGINSRAEKAQEDAKRALQAQSEAEKARMTAEAAQRDAESKFADLQQQLGAAETSIADLEKTRESMRKEATALQNQLDTLVSKTGVSLAEITAMPLIQGRVISTVDTPAPGLVAINKGKTDNVKPGYTFEIYNGGTYKGQVRVDYVHDTTCSAVIVRPVPGQTIRQGDSASTSLR